MRTRQKVVSNFSTVTKGASSAAKPRAALKQVFLNQGVSDRNLTAEERSQLDVLKQELETFAVPISLKWRWREESHGSMLERNWTEIVNSHSIMTRMQRHQQEAMWEFVLTELNYINRLIVIKDLVIAALVNLHLRGFLQEVTPERLFSNLPAILSAHQLFWQEVIYPMLQEVRMTGKPFNPMGLNAGCLQFRERFSPYCHYCAEEENSFEFARLQMESNPQFLTYVQWVETHPQCARMRLGDMQAKPHQRITKYALLLKAVLKTTQEPPVQRSLRGMLSSVNTFLESINDYLRLKDEEAALSLSAQRLEGYEMEGISEEIDKHVREICQFDLTCPIVGVGHGIVRKLLLEENLKVRGRKDSKLEVVALLFTDVLLVTKVQKKTERLKVVRPPLALDRTYCIALKDNCSFLLVEVGELWCPVNVYIFTAGTSESCSSWVSAIHQAKVILRTMRREGDSRQSSVKKTTSAAVDETYALISEEEGFSDLGPRKREVSQLVNGAHASKHASENPHKHFEVLPQKFVLKDFGCRGGTESMIHRESSTNARKPGAQSVPDLNEAHMRGDVIIPLRRVTSRPNTLVPGGYPDVDYPTDESTTSSAPDQRRPSGKGTAFLANTRIVNSQSVNYSREKNHNPAIFDGSAESKALAKSFKSPVLQKRRTHNGHQGLPARSASNNSSSNSDSDCGVNPKSSKSHFVLKLGALKPTRGSFWTSVPIASPDAEIFSESELTTRGLQNKKSRLKTQRSASISNMSSQEEQRVHFADGPAGMSASAASLEDLLRRAKGRTRDGETVKSRKLPGSPLTSSSPSRSASDVDRDGEWEEEVRLQRPRVLTVSRRWKEQLVDGDGNDRLDSPIPSNGINVDWPGWCFDDDNDDELQEDSAHRRTPGVLEDINQSLILWHLSEQEDNFCSQV
ncbi:uncharacterized protein plekhg6 [Hippocampus zosterae]|uniref:uncharacterized protein plekhg6 n=1 Tax=Hippocampus zosterae TaxID=109293 RepID=UPI00223D9580|nr:uncharacterized protein plekhg6 [Hippocampus zosterae]